MSERKPPASPAARRATTLFAIALFLFVASYRFNTLGGALGGFDDDHFVGFAYAKQVQAGEQPLRDFTGLGLHGAWPSLTFELSAAAQSLLGDTLRSEALLCVIALAAGAVLTFLAASLVSAPPLALAATLLSVFLAPKLYNYPKVLVLAAAAFGVGWYARRPSPRVALALGALTAAAFLLRHDYAVYVALGVVVVMALASGWRQAFVHAAAYGLITIVLLTPSILFVQRYAGLGAYVRESRYAAAHEANRTTQQWPAFAAPFGVSEENAVAWLYYFHLALPVVVLLLLWRARREAPPAVRDTMIAVAAMALLVAPMFLRGNTAARFGDMAPLFAVLLAGGLALAFERGRASVASWSLTSALALAASVVTALSIWTIGDVSRELDASGWSDSPRKLTGQATRLWSELDALPAAYWSGTPDSPSIATAQYLHSCTQPSDRIVVMSYQPELLPLADRRFAGGRGNLVAGLLTDEPHEQEILARWRAHSVPIVLAEDDDDYRTEIPRIHAFLHERYALAGTTAINGGELQVFTRRDLVPAGTFKDTGLPCFR